MAGYLALGLLAALVAFALYVRLAPSDPARWHVAPVAEGPAGQVQVRLSIGMQTGLGNPPDMLAKMDRVALSTPRTTRLAGSVEEGRITWVTRSWLWGFPDYTTAEARTDGLYVMARSRFGHGDLGVNASRLRNWMFSL